MDVEITRWLGKPTSGRYVYKGRTSGKWWWQCDLHDEEDDLPSNSWGQSRSWAEALARLLEHAGKCPNRAVAAPSGVCHCGSPVEDHSPWDNHSPVDMVY